MAMIPEVIVRRQVDLGEFLFTGERRVSGPAQGGSAQPTLEETTPSPSGGNTGEKVASTNEPTRDNQHQRKAK
jgi:hypothetical protein